MKTWPWILLLLTLGACGQKRELITKEASKEFCDCFNSQTTGSIDDKLNPCLQKIVEDKQTELNSGIINPDSIQEKFSKFTLDIMLDMTRSCDKYFAEINDLYDNSYSIDTTTLNKNAINELTIRIKEETNKDSVKSLLHKKVFKLIQAREFDLALQSIDSIKSVDNTDYGANLASAYIFNQTGFHDKAMEEIDKAIAVTGNENLKLFAEISRRKKQTSGK